MRIRTAFLLLIIGAVMFWPTDIAHSETEWGSVAEGIDFQQFVLPGPNRAFVARMDRSSPNVIVDSTVAQGKLYEGTETVSGMAHNSTLSAFIALCWALARAGTYKDA